jgi:putative NADPH-quinone reductase
VFIYPIWWFGPPAILKGWIDRVFTRKFAFDFTATGMKGLLTHEKALILNTLGGDEATYQTNAGTNCWSGRWLRVFWAPAASATSRTGRSTKCRRHASRTAGDAGGSSGIGGDTSG